MDVLMGMAGMAEAALGVERAIMVGWLFVVLIAVAIFGNFKSPSWLWIPVLLLGTYTLLFVPYLDFVVVDDADDPDVVKHSRAYQAVAYFWLVVCAILIVCTFLSIYRAVAQVKDQSNTEIESDMS